MTCITLTIAPVTGETLTIGISDDAEVVATSSPAGGLYVSEVRE